MYALIHEKFEIVLNSAETDDDLRFFVFTNFKSLQNWRVEIFLNFLAGFFLNLKFYRQFNFPDYILTFQQQQINE